MAAVPSLLTDSTTAVALYRLHSLMDTTCRSACDLDLGSCAALCAVAAQPQGFEVGEARKTYSFSGNNATFEYVLKERELIEVVRSSRDRRTLAFRATPKGRDRVVLAYRVLGACLVQEHTGLTEQNFDQLINLSYEYAEAAGFPVTFEGLFPSLTLRDLAAYEHRFELVAARFGMTSAQVALLFAWCEEAADSQVMVPASFEKQGSDLGLSPWVLEAELRLLRDRGLIPAAGVMGTTEAACQRTTEFVQRFAVALLPWWQTKTPRCQAAVMKLLHYVLYLFS